MWWCLQKRLHFASQLLLNNSHCFHLHPTVPSVHVFIANLKLVSALPNKVFHPFKELVVISRAAKLTTEKMKVDIKHQNLIFLSSK